RRRPETRTPTPPTPAPSRRATSWHLPYLTKCGTRTMENITLSRRTTLSSQFTVRATALGCRRPRRSVGPHRKTGSGQCAGRRLDYTLAGGRDLDRSFGRRRTPTGHSAAREVRFDGS